MHIKIKLLNVIGAAAKIPEVNLLFMELQDHILVLPCHFLCNDKIIYVM